MPPAHGSPPALALTDFTVLPKASPCLASGLRPLHCPAGNRFNSTGPERADHNIGWTQPLLWADMREWGGHKPSATRPTRNRHHGGARTTVRAPERD